MEWDGQCVNEAIQLCGCSCGGPGGAGGSGGEAGAGGEAGVAGAAGSGGLVPACDVPAEPPSKGACLKLSADIVCNPVSGEACTQAGHACDFSEKGYACYPPPNDGKLCEPCDNQSKFCQNGLTCEGGTCVRYCCEDADCGPGNSCIKGDALAGRCFQTP
jgi:hypothetical protein